MKKIMFLALAIFAVANAASAQKLVLGEKAPDLKVKEWLSSKPSDDGKARLIEFYHTSSKPCEARLDQLEALAKKHAGKLNVIIISKEPRDKVEKILLPGPRSYYPAIDDGNKTFDNFGVKFIPFSVLVDRKGRVAWFGNPSSLDDDTITENL